MSYGLSVERKINRARDKVKTLAVPGTNRKAILSFSEFCFSDGLSSRRVLKYIYTLCTIALRFPKEFNKANRDDIEKLVNGIERSNYSEWTKRDFRITLKKFYRWLRQADDYPPEVKWLRSTMRNKRAKLPDEILTQEEVQKLITAALTTRDKAFIAFLYESGCRIGELLDLRIKQIQQHPHGFQITVEGKKGSRRILLIACVPYLTTWLNNHPRREDPGAPLWITTDYRVRKLSYARMNSILKNTAKRAGIHKAVNPHNFRHSRATHLARHLTEAQMKEYLGWVQGSDMASTYVHLSGRDIDSALLKLNDIPTHENDDNTNNFSSKTCPRCSISNPPANKFCSRCGIILNEKTAREIIKSNMERNKADEIMDRLLQDQELKAMLKRKLEELNKSNNRS